MKLPTNFKRKKQEGAVIIVCLFVLLAVMALGVFGMRNVTLSERAAGNTLEKQRSLQAAESALRYGEWWLSRNNHGEYRQCDDSVSGNTISLMRVCVNKLENPEIMTWSGYASYTPDKMKVMSAGSTIGGLADNGDVVYYSQPNLYIYYLGKNRRGEFFQLSAAGYGGQESTASVVQSTFTFSLNSIDLGGL